MQIELLTLYKYICRISPMNRKSISILVDHFGSQTKTAQAIGVKQQNVWYWLNSEIDMPLELVPKAAKAMGKPPSFLRPDIFGNQDA